MWHAENPLQLVSHGQTTLCVGGGGGDSTPKTAFWLLYINEWWCTHAGTVIIN